MLVTPPIQAPEQSGRMYFAPRIAGSRTMFGFSSELPYWAAVSKLYDEDKLEGAAEFLQETGIGFGASGLSLYRLVEAELATRLHGVKRNLSPHLSIEFVEEEQQGHLEPMTALIKQSTEGLRQRFGWQ